MCCLFYFGGSTCNTERKNRLNHTLLHLSLDPLRSKTVSSFQRRRRTKTRRTRRMVTIFHVLRTTQVYPHTHQTFSLLHQFLPSHSLEGDGETRRYVVSSILSFQQHTIFLILKVWLSVWKKKQIWCFFVFPNVFLDIHFK